MKKTIKLVFLCIVFSLGFFAGNARASVASDFSLSDAPFVQTEPWKRMQFDKLAMDVVIPSNIGEEDFLSALAIMNLGSARDGKGVGKLILWADDKTSGFQGMGIDSKVGEAEWDSASYTWYWKNLSLAVPAQGLRVFISVEIEDNLDDSRTVQLAIPKFEDANKNKEFDAGDKGVFMSSGNNGPADQEIKNISIQSIRHGSSDQEGPKSAITNLFGGDEIAAEKDFTIYGLSRDQGKLSVKSVQISIVKEGLSESWANVSTDKLDFADWQHVWHPSEIGNYEVRLKSADIDGNESVSDPLTVIAAMPVEEISADKSTVEISPASAPADGVSSAAITVTAKDAQGNPLSGKEVTVFSSRGIDDAIFAINQTTDENGVATFEIKSAKAGEAAITAMVGDLALTQVSNINFTAEEILPEGIKEGDLIRAEGDYKVYIVKGKHKRWIQSSEIFNFYGHLGFAAVKEVAKSRMENYAESWLIRAEGDARVYEINSDGTKHWINITAEEFAAAGRSWDMVYVVNEQERDFYVAGADVLR